MKTITASQIEQAVFDAFIQANFVISDDIRRRLEQCLESEPSDTAQQTLCQILQNYDVAQKERIAICQDCGMALIFAEVGTEVHITGSFNQAVTNGVRRAYDEGYLRKSVVNDPLFDRLNTRDNTPPIINTTLTDGDELKLTVVAKGFGSENCGRLRMFVPSNTLEEIKDFIVETTLQAGPNACPPTIVGVGIGGSMEVATLLAKKATIRSLELRHPDPRYAQLEAELLQRINASGLGPGGLGGATTALAVNIETYPTHIVAIPVAVNLCCHASRHYQVVL